jgi:hypothetical protein
MDRDREVEGKCRERYYQHIETERTSEKTELVR